MSHHCRTPQKNIPIEAVPKNAAIDPLYSGCKKKGCNRQYIVAFFAPAAKKLPQQSSFFVVLPLLYIYIYIYI